MKNRFVAAVMAGTILATCSTAFAGVESVVCDGNNVVVTGTASMKMPGERYSLMLHNLYDVENPAESVVIAEQGITGENGSFTYTIPLSETIGDGSYTLRYGDNSGTAEEIDVLIDRDSAELLASIDEVGHIFFDPSKIEVNVTLSNGQTAQTKNIVARVYTEEENELVFEDIVSTLEMKAQERFSDKLTIDLTEAEKQYGMFVLKLAFVSEGVEPTDEDFSQSIRFSVAKKSDEQSNKIGIHTQFGLGRANPEVNAMLLKNSGYVGIRDMLAHSQCFADGVWNEPELYNKWIDDVTENDLSQIIMINSNDIGFPKTEAEIEHFTDFAVAVVTNLVEDGVYLYELWNEPNSSYTPEEYANLLISVAPAVHAVDENVKLIAFATAWASNHKSANWIVDIIKILKERGLNPHDYIDYISVHPYRPLNQAPEKKTRTCNCTYGNESFEAGQSQVDTNDTIPGDSSIVARIDNITNRLAEVNCEDIPFIITEIGWFSYEGAYSSTNCEECIANKTTALSEIGQAQYSVRASALLYNKVEKMYFHTLNNKLSTATPMEKNFGFTENWNATQTEIPYEAKPAFIAMANFNAVTAGAELVEENVDESSWTSLWTMSNYDYVFKKGEKKTHMMWTTSSYNRSKTINVPGKAICIYDMYGNVVDKKYNDNGKYSISLSGSPVYVEEIAVTEIKIVDKNGKAVSAIGDNVELCANMSSLNEKNEKGTLICATYKDNMLLSVEASSVEVGESLAITPYINTENADTVKAFYWKETNNTPYCEAVTIFR